MHFAHLPAGYITSRLLFKHFKLRAVSYRQFIFWGLFGSIAPDFDLIYFLVFSDNIDQATQTYTTHHTYITHFPIFWLSLLIISFLWMKWSRHRSQAASLAVIFTLGGFIHMILDVIADSTLVFAPFDNKAYSLENTFPDILHDLPYWELGLEFCIIVWALSLWLKRS